MARSLVIHKSKDAAEIVVNGNKIDSVMRWELKEDAHKSSIVLEIDLTGGTIEVKT